MSVVVVPAVIQHLSIELSSDFGYHFACRLFGEDVIDSLPKPSRGRNRFRPAGFLNWERVTVPGWSTTYNRYIGRGVVWAHISRSLYGDKDHAVQADWRGRIQPLSGGPDVVNALRPLASGMMVADAMP